MLVWSWGIRGWRNNAMKEYVKVQIIKHALMRYVERPEATEKEIKQEKELIDRYTEKANYLKERYRIK